LNVVSLDGAWFLARLRDPDFGGGQNGSVAIEEIDALAVTVCLVDTTEPLDIGVALRLEDGPVEFWLANTLEFVSGSMTKPVSDISSMPHQLFGNTP
jgi:hypothetical protein